MFITVTQCTTTSKGSACIKFPGIPENNMHVVNKLRQNVGLQTWIWRHVVTSQTA